MLRLEKLQRDLTRNCKSPVQHCYHIAGSAHPVGFGEQPSRRRPEQELRTETVNHYM